MEIYNPNELKLPALKLEKTGSRKEIEENEKVKNLINSKMLLNKDLNQLIINFLGISKRINQLLERRDEWVEKSSNMGDQGEIFYRDMFMKGTLPLKEFHLFRKLKHGTIQQRKELEKELQLLLINERKKHHMMLKANIDKLSNILESELDEFEKKYSVELDILENLSLYICKECKKILNFGRFHSTDCLCGKKISNNSDCEILTIYKFGDKLMKFIENNMWLEHGIDFLFRKALH